MRLSVDDESYGDSVSIETQRTILRAYAKEHGFPVYDEYVDDGWSGTSFDRPAFQRMLADADAGRIGCIITKDLSRLGREHVMMDYYLEFVFPEKRIRYIAVTDNEDTEHGLSDFVPFKNLFNEWLAKDTSRKVKAAYRAKYAAGEYICTHAPLGYKKDPEHPNRLLIDEDTRWIVERIFDLAAHGHGAQRIAKLLAEEQVPTPSWLHYQRDGSFAHIHGENPGEKAYRWTDTYVKSLLTNEVYIGNSVQNKKHSISYKNRKMIRSPKEEWIRVENTHEGIISAELFERVQLALASRRRSTRENTVQIFAGLTRCGGCGRALGYGTNRAGKKPIAYFNCSGYRRYGTARAGCTQHYIRYDALYAVILARLRVWAALTPPEKQRLLAGLLRTSGREGAAAAKKRASELAKAEKRKAELDRIFSILFEDRAAGRITEYNYEILSEKYQAEQAALAERTVRLKESAGKPADDGSAQRWGALIEKYAAPTELTAELLQGLIEKITVHEAVKLPNGVREQELEIFYRFPRAEAESLSQTVSDGSPAL